MVFFEIPNDPLFIFLFCGVIFAIWGIFRLISGPGDQEFRCPHCYRDFTRPKELRHLKEANCPHCSRRITF